jgi:hypothetical protein
VVVEFIPEELERILDFLDHSVTTYDSKAEPKMVEAVEYVKGKFYPATRDLLEELKRSGLK